MAAALGRDDVGLVVGLASGLGVLLLIVIIFAVYFLLSCTRQGRIMLGRGEPGDYDDEQALLVEEENAMDIMDEFQRNMYYLAKAYQTANPPNSIPTDISLSQYLSIQEKGVSAWAFEPDFEHANCFVEGRTEISFYDAECSVQTNLPVPKQNEVYYWEAKLFDKPAQTLVSIGMATKPYPTFRLPGYNKYSVAYDSLGMKRYDQPFPLSEPKYGPVLHEGDVVGVGYRPRTGTIFFTRNGKRLEEALTGLKFNLFPTIGATGPCTVHVNFGQAGFVFIEANVKKWGLAPASGSLAPPPPYGVEQGSILLESANGAESASPSTLERQRSIDSDFLSRNSNSINLENISAHIQGLIGNSSAAPSASSTTHPVSSPFVAPVFPSNAHPPPPPEYQSDNDSQERSTHHSRKRNRSNASTGARSPPPAFDEITNQHNGDHNSLHSDNHHTEVVDREPESESNDSSDVPIDNNETNEGASTGLQDAPATTSPHPEIESNIRDNEEERDD